MQRAFGPADSIGLEVIERIARAEVDASADVGSVASLVERSIDPVLRVELRNATSFILKIRYGAGQAVFGAETRALRYLAEKTALPVPRVLAHSNDGSQGPYTYLVLECLPGLRWDEARARLDFRGRRQLDEDLGELLGRMHREVAGEAFCDVLSAKSAAFSTWPELFSRLWQDRIQELLETDRLDPATLDAVAWIHGSVPRILDSGEPPRLVHGNLAPEKVLCARRGERWAVSGFLDPAPLLAHHEVDLARLELFDMVDAPFFDTYTEQLPIGTGYQLRKRLYQLYTVLDQVRLYGDTHLILNAMEKVRGLLRECG